MKLTRRKLWIAVALLLPVLLLSGLFLMSLFSKRPDQLGLAGGRLRACPASPNCVCSCEESSDAQHFIPPLKIPDGLEEPMETLVSVIDSFSRTEIVTREENYLHAEFTSRLLRFVDDVEIQIVPEEGVIHVRSASRVGYSDLGANRRRVEQIRAEWKQAVQK